MKTTIGRLAGALFIIGGIIAYLTVGVNLFDRVRNSAIRIELKAIDRALQGEHDLNGRYPENFAAFMGENFDTRGVKKVGTDPWGQIYRYALISGGFRVVSSGPDRRQGTPDDVCLVRDDRGMSIESSGGFQEMTIRQVEASGSPASDAGDEAFWAELRSLLDPGRLRESRPRLEDDDMAEFLTGLLSSSGAGQ